MRKIIFYSVLSIIAILSYYKIANAQSGINNSFSGIYNIGFASTPTPAPTAAPTATSIPLPLSLVNGGTHSDLSGTGGTSQVLKQTSVGGNVSVARLACADLSDSATTCSATPTAAPAPTVVPTASNLVFTNTVNVLTQKNEFIQANGLCIKSLGSKDLCISPSGTFNTADRTVTIDAPDSASDIPTLQNAQIWTARQSFTAGTTLGSDQYTFLASPPANTEGTLPGWNTAQTPDTQQWRLGSTSNAAQIIVSANTAFDYQNGNCGTSACTDPSVWIFSHNSNTAQWGGFWHDATNFNIKTGTGGVKITNHLILAGTAPTLSACGTSPTTVTGSDNAGHFTVGSSATTCTLTFNATWSVIPECFVNDQSAILSVLAVPTTTTITFTTTVASAISSQLISYHCVQGS